MSGAPTLRSILDASAEGLDGVRTTSGTGGAISWAHGEREFAVLDGDAVEIRLDGPIAAAAIRTPDSTVSPRGPEWVRFAPTTLDGHAVDRLTAWFALGYRRAGS